MAVFVAFRLLATSESTFGPEENKAIELGTKWELFDRHLLVTAALFQTEKDDAQKSQNITTVAAAETRLVSLVSSGPRPLSCITAGAAYRIRGIDLGVGGKLTDKWSVFGGLVLMQSEVTKSLIPSPQPLILPPPILKGRSPTSPGIIQPC